nr:hypothetical protein GCM10020063_010500 [Dactylosporangium thailandense]
MAIWPTTDPDGGAIGDGGGIVTVRVGDGELSAGHLGGADLVPQRYRHRSGTVQATGHDAAAMALAAVAARIIATLETFTAGLGRTADGDQVTGVPGQASCVVREFLPAHHRREERLVCARFLRDGFIERKTAKDIVWHGTHRQPPSWQTPTTYG